MDFEQDIRAHVLSNLPHDSGVAQELAAKSARDLLIIFRNWMNRHVNPHPRIIHRSKALDRNPLASDPAYQPALEEIVRKIQNGEDLTPFLSRGIQNGYRSTQGLPPGQLQRRKDLDLLLNDWRVHHLHLSTHLEGDGFVTRTEPLLFAIFLREDAYLIDIIGHGGWYRDHVLNVIVNNWRDVGIVEEVPAAALALKNLSEDDRKVLRNAGVTTAFEVDGKFYSLTSALSTAGTSLDTILGVITVFKKIAWFENELTKDSEFVSRHLIANGYTAPSTLDLHFAFFDEGGYGVIERNTNFRLRLSH